MTKSLRENVFEYVKEKYQSQIEYPWFRFPNYCVFRHSDNNKWYGLIMNIPYEKLKIQKQGYVDVLNAKINDCFLRDMLLQQDGIFPGYHIAKGNWISILLDGTIDIKQICDIIDQSFLSTSPKQKNKI